MLCLCGILFLSTSCNQPEINTDKKGFGGYVQKGPFINGSTVTISELDKELNQTGRSYNTIIEDNSGKFQQQKLELISNFVQLKADGYFYNEVTSKTSTGQITLYALADITNVNSANINILTHMEKGRLEHLMKEEGLPFSEAKQQAQREILGIFNLEAPSGKTSESLNLTNDGLLVAISCIVQGYLPAGEMMQLLASINTDIKTDGILNDGALGSRLISNAKMLDLPSIRQNLESKYKQLGISATIPEFETYIEHFIANSDFETLSYISYPESGLYGINILADGVNSIVASYLDSSSPDEVSYSMKADVPSEGSLKIILRNGEWAYMSSPGPINWQVGLYDAANKYQEMTVIEPGKMNDLRFFPVSGEDNGCITVEYYENGSKTPTKTKLLKIIER